MSAAAARSAQSLERLTRLTRLGGWLFVVGFALGLASAVALAGSGLGPPRLSRALEAMQTPYGLVASAVLVVGAVAAVAGLALHVVVPGLDSRLARRDWDSPRVILGCLAAVFVLGNVLTLPVLLLGEQPVVAGQLPVSSLVVAMLATDLALVAVLIWRIVRPGAITWEQMGLTTAHLERRLAQGALGGVLIFVLAGVAALAMRQVGIEQTQVRMFDGIRNASPGQFLGFWLAASVVAPMCEECFFRGYVFGALRGRYGRPIAYVASAVLFAGIHMNLAALAPIVVMALGLAFLYERTGSVVPSIVAHGFNNAVALTLLYAGLGG